MFGTAFETFDTLVLTSGWRGPNIVNGVLGIEFHNYLMGKYVASIGRYTQNEENPDIDIGSRIASSGGKCHVSCSPPKLSVLQDA